MVREREVLVACSDKSMKVGVNVWDINTGNNFLHIPSCASLPFGLLCLRNRYLVASQLNRHGSVGGGSIVIWSLNKPLKPLVNYTMEAIGPLSCTKDGLYLVGGGFSGNVYIWDVTSGELLKSWIAHNKPLNCMLFSDDNSLLISGSDDGMICVWSMISLLDVEESRSLPSLLHCLLGHMSTITGLLTLPGSCSSVLVSSSLDGTCKVWDIISGKLLQSQVYSLPITSISLDHGHEFLFYGIVNGTIIVNKLNIGLEEGPITFGQSFELKGHSGSITALTSCQAGLISGSEDCTICIWNVINRTIIRRFNLQKGAESRYVYGDEHTDESGNKYRASYLRTRTTVETSKHQVIQAVVRSDAEIEISESKKGGGLRGKLNKVVLAYSGGLDTSVIVPWLRENYGCDVVCFTADVGQGIKELDGLEAKAKASGASQLVVKDLREEFVKDYIFPCLRAGAVYERKYLLGTSMARPVIAKAMVDVAKEVGADAVSHGCTGKGNDQAWREDAIEYAKKHNVPVPVTKKSIYSRDRNLWHLSHEGDILEDPANEPKKDMFMMSIDPEDAPNQAEYVEIGIESGLPVSVNGKRLSPASLLAELNEVGGKHGIGRIDMVENRLVGMKSRGVYETPGGTILFAAVRELESLTLDRETIQVKDSLALKYAELVYAGRWFDPLRESMDAFMQKITETTTGSVTLKLYKGSVTVTGRTSPFSLYRQDISSFESGEIYNQADAAGFIRLYGLPMRVRAMLEQGI
ncbi:hypothetical protein TanjilG_27525 [Lupinus angustifolius]|uniref:argininosuccinate synthase n=1 Tax=Lupinus angustifolius TaxID=3871 RepID=A0A4P1R3A7_LUPAN|nr:hypothetical protein TanjilG_27525 [Lupinus angustifolius]